MSKERARNSTATFGLPGRRSRASRTPAIESRLPRPRILIVCEGAKTEPNYFLAFKVTNDVVGAGVETLRVVEEAQRLNESDGPFDQIWCVFDRDSFPADNFDNAIHKVQSMVDRGFRVAYSNEAFELWYVLHFEFLHAALSREDYIKKLDGHLKRPYTKGDPGIYDALQQLGNEERAMGWAEKLKTAHAPETPPSRCCPKTTVHHLVRELRGIQRDSGQNRL